MPDEFRVIWAYEASIQIHSIKIYLQNTWGKNQAKKIFHKLQRFEQLVIRFPKLYPASLKYPTLRKAVITKYHSVIYEIDNQIIKVHTILDHRQKPDQ